MRDIGGGEMLTGNWTNQLGSRIKIEASDGFINGNYYAAVMTPESVRVLPPPTPLYGTFQASDDGILLTFNVQWRFDESETEEYTYSVCSWCGKFFYKKPYEFHTTWLLVGNARLPDVWKNVLTNQDVFHRV